MVIMFPNTKKVKLYKLHIKFLAPSELKKKRWLTLKNIFTTYGCEVLMKRGQNRVLRSDGLKMSDSSVQNSNTNINLRCCVQWKSLTFIVCFYLEIIINMFFRIVLWNQVCGVQWIKSNFGQFLHKWGAQLTNISRLIYRWLLLG